MFSKRYLILLSGLLLITPIYSLPAIQLSNFKVHPSLIYGGEHFYSEFDVKNIAEFDIPVVLQFKLSYCEGITISSLQVDGVTYSPSSRENCTWTFNVTIPKRTTKHFHATFVTHPAIEPIPNLTLTLSIYSDTIVDVQRVRETKIIRSGGGGASSYEVREIVKEETKNLNEKVNQTAEIVETINESLKEISKAVHDLTEDVNVLNQNVKEQNNKYYSMVDIISRQNYKLTKKVEKGINTLNETKEQVTNTSSTLYNVSVKINQLYANILDEISTLSDTLKTSMYVTCGMFVALLLLAGLIIKMLR